MMFVCRDYLPRTATYRFYRPLLHNAAEGRWPMSPYARLWGIHPVYLFIQDYALDLDDQNRAATPHVKSLAAPPEVAPDSD